MLIARWAFDSSPAITSILLIIFSILDFLANLPRVSAVRWDREKKHPAVVRSRFFCATVWWASRDSTRSHRRPSQHGRTNSSAVLFYHSLRNKYARQKFNAFVYCRTSLLYFNGYLSHHVRVMLTVIYEQVHVKLQSRINWTKYLLLI